MQKKRRMKKSLGEKVFSFVVVSFLILMFIITLYPMIFVISASFSDPYAVNGGDMLLFPVSPTLEGYQQSFKESKIWIGYGNTILYTVLGTAFNLFLTLPCGYALSRNEFRGKGFVMGMFLITMYFSGGMIPSYINISQYGLVNTRLVMIIMGGISTYNLIVCRTFFNNNVPFELTESAYLDGASDIKVFLKIILPLSAPIIVVLGLYYGIGHWNEYMQALIYLRDRSLYPLQVYLKELLTDAQDAAQIQALTEEEILQLELAIANTHRMKYVVIVLASAPLMIIFPKIQKYFDKGVLVGSVKG